MESDTHVLLIMDKLPHVYYVSYCMADEFDQNYFYLATYVTVIIPFKKCVKKEEEERKKKGDNFTLSKLH